jgi:hypothetical protein
MVAVDAGVDRFHHRQAVALGQGIAVAGRYGDHGVIAGQAGLLQPRHLAALVGPDEVPGEAAAVGVAFEDLGFHVVREEDRAGVDPCRHQDIGVREIHHHRVRTLRQRQPHDVAADGGPIRRGGHRQSAARRQQPLQLRHGGFRPPDEPIAGGLDVSPVAGMIGRCGGHQGDVERAAPHAAQDVAGADLAALVHGEKESGADEQQPRLHQHRP